jgi:hypothetical protein
MPVNRHDVMGRRFERLLVVSKIRIRGRVRWRCVCDCGGHKIVQKGHLISGDIKSCGCFRREQSWLHNQLHGHSGNGKSPTYTSWYAMIRRCTNPNHDYYYLYGGRGINVCERWRNSFIAFLADMGERPDGMTLDRVNSDGDYTPDNCRWANNSQQILNRRNINDLT